MYDTDRRNSDIGLFVLGYLQNVGVTEFQSNLLTLVQASQLCPSHLGGECLHEDRSVAAIVMSDYYTTALALEFSWCTLCVVVRCMCVERLCVGFGTSRRRVRMSRVPLKSSATRPSARCDGR